MYFISSHLFMLYCLVFKLIIKVVVTLLFDHDQQPIDLSNGTVFKTLLFHLLHDSFWFLVDVTRLQYVCVNVHIEMYSSFLIKCLPIFLLLHILGYSFLCSSEIHIKKNVYIVQDKKAFADILRKISKIQRTNGSNYVVLRDRWLDPNTSAFHCSWCPTS